MGKWRADTVSTVCHDPLASVFWAVVEIANKTRSPLGHHQRFLQHLDSDDDIWLKGSKLAQLAFGKTNCIMKEFDDILLDCNWLSTHSDTLPLAAAAAVPGDGIVALGVELTCHYAVGYWRRVVCEVTKSEA